MVRDATIGAHLQDITDRITSRFQTWNGDTGVIGPQP
jgi:hypothetical protein